MRTLPVITTTASKRAPLPSSSASNSREEDIVPELALAFGAHREHTVNIPPRQVHYTYRPIWEPKRNVVVKYLCQPIPPDHKTHHMQLCIALAQDGQFALDVLLLRQVANRISELRKAGCRIMAACPIHLSTLGAARHWSQYLAALDSTPRETLADIVFVVSGVNEATPRTRLITELPKLRSRSKYLYAVVTYKEGVVARLANTGVNAVGIELPHVLSGEKQALSTITALTRDAHAMGLEPFVLGARSTSIISGAIAAGVRYIEGEAVCPAVPQPKHAFSCEPNLRQTHVSVN